MKKVRSWIIIIASVIGVAVWAVMGLKLYDGNYEIRAEAYTMLACLIVIAACAISRMFTDKCPYCGKLRVSNGKYCPHCGKEI